MKRQVREVKLPSAHEMHMLEVDRLYDAICEGRREDAIELLRIIYPHEQYRPLHVQRNLFPDRIPA